MTVKTVTTITCDRCGASETLRGEEDENMAFNTTAFVVVAGPGPLSAKQFFSGDLCPACHDIMVDRLNQAVGAHPTSWGGSQWTPAQLKTIEAAGGKSPYER